MLRIVQNRSAGGAKSYFSQESYYSDGQELQGIWGGKTAQLLGLSGFIEQKDFDALCDNTDPRSHNQLTVRTKTDRTVGYDFNFHVPKGVSLAYALRGDERILDAFQVSVNETMQDIEHDAKTRVRIGGKQEDRVTGNLAWGQFIHRTSRPVSGLEDPLLHAHCFVFNVVFDEKESRFKAAQFRDLKRHAPFYESLFHARFGKRLQELGYQVKRDGRKWDIVGISSDLKKKFSRRTEQIEAEAKKRGITDADKKSELGAKTREAKSKDRTFPELQRIWREQLDEGDQEWGNQPLPTPERLTPETIKERSHAAMQAAISHCFEREAVVGERTLQAEALRRGIGYVALEDVIREQNKAGVITRQVDGIRMCTTLDVVREEQSILKAARNGRGQATQLNGNWSFKREWLSDEQKRAVQQLVSSRDKIQILRGDPGTGKTTLMHEAIEAIEAGGHIVLTFAPSAAASRGVLHDDGFENATTVAELLINKEIQSEAAGQVLWIDEAGLLSTPQLNQVIELSERLGARLILGGDYKQHGSVQRGGILKLLEEQAGLKTATISSIRRQYGEYRRAVEEVAAGNICGGFDRLNQLGWVHEIDDDRRNSTIAKEYVDSVEQGESSLVISPTNLQAQELTAAIRNELTSRKLLSTQSQQFVRLEPVHFTESERRDAAFYRPGDVIVFHQNAPGHKKGERITVKDLPNRELLGLANRFGVYRSSMIAIAPGDRIRFTSNIKTKDGQHRLHNGTCHSVRSITRGGDLVLANGWQVGREAGFLDYGFVSTSHSSQGQTVDRVFIAESSDSFGAAGKEQFLVSISRARKQAVIYTDSKLELRSVLQRSQAKVTATDLLDLNKERQRTIQKHKDWLKKVRLVSSNRQPEIKKELQYGVRQ